RHHCTLYWLGGPVAAVRRRHFPALFPIKVSPQQRSAPVSEPQATPSETQRKYKEFMDMMPLALALAGLPASEVGRYFGEEQIETRVFAVRHAYKAAKGLIR